MHGISIVYVTKICEWCTTDVLHVKIRLFTYCVYFGLRITLERYRCTIVAHGNVAQVVLPKPTE